MQDKYPASRFFASGGQIWRKWIMAEFSHQASLLIPTTAEPGESLATRDVRRSRKDETAPMLRFSQPMDTVADQG